MAELSMGYIVGIMVGIVLVVLLLKLVNKNGRAKTEYDERQQIERGKAYKWGFFAALLTCAVLLILETFDTIIPVLGMTAWFLPIVAGVIAQVSYSIFHDAYEGLNTNMHRFVIVMALIAVFNIGFAVVIFAREGFWDDGKLAPQFLNLLCGILCVVMAVELLIKKCLDRREEREDA